MKKGIKITSVLMLVALLLSLLPVSAFAGSKTVDLNQNFLFRKNMPVQIQGVSDDSETNIYKLTYTPQYTATYTLKFYGRIGSINGANINTWGRLYDGDGNLLAEAEYETRSSENIPSYLYYPNGTITYRLEKGKSYYYEVEGFLPTRTYTVYIDLTSDESGLLDAENGLKVRLNKVEFDEYSPQTVLDNLFLILYDADKNSFVWRYKDAGGNLLFNGADVIIDMSECGRVGTNTIRVHYLGYEATTDFVVKGAASTTNPTTEPPTSATTTTAKPTTAHQHTQNTTVTPATTSKDGKITKSCPVCKKTLSVTAIPKIKSVALSAGTYTYNGKTKKPSVTVKDSKGKKISSSNYTVSYSSGRKNVGQYTVTVKFKGNYSGSAKRTFTIKPKSTSISKVTAGKKKFTVKWKKQSSQTTGYQIQYSTSSKFKSAKTVTVGKNKTTSKSISKLKAKKKYYVRVRTYKTVKINGKNTKIYSSWSKAKSVTTKK